MSIHGLKAVAIQFLAWAPGFELMLIADCRLVTAVTFLSSYSVSPDIANTTTLAALVNSITMFTIPVGLIFETPVILYFLAKIGLVSSAFLIQYRKHSFVFIIILAAIITPSPDVFSQMLVAIPLYLLYEVSIIVVKRIDKERAAKEASESLDANSN